MAKNYIYLYNDSPHKTWIWGEGYNCKFDFLEYEIFKLNKRMYCTEISPFMMEEIGRNKFLKIFQYKKDLDKYVKNKKGNKLQISRFEIMDI